MRSCKKLHTNGTQLKTQPALTRTQHGLSFWRCWKARERPRSRARRVQGLWAPAKESGDKVVDRKRFSALRAEEWRGFRTERSSWTECGTLLTMRSGSESYWWVGVQNDYRASNNLQWWGNKSRPGQGRGLIAVSVLKRQKSRSPVGTWRPRKSDSESRVQMGSNGEQWGEPLDQTAGPEFWSCPPGSSPSNVGQSQSWRAGGRSNLWGHS